VIQNFSQQSFSKKKTTLLEPIFWNFTFDKTRLKQFVSWFLKTHGEKKTLEFLEQLKTLGFGYATKAGISLGIEDLKIPPEKIALLAHAEKNVAESILLYRKGETTGIEKMQRFIEAWHETSEILKDEVVRSFEKTDVLNPVYMMAFSGARGNLSQVRQLVGMRGLMSDPQGKIIDFPILSNFREGLTLTEYLISTYGARKGIVDTALRTATAGYLTRRLVDVAQHVFVSKFDCGTRRGIFLFDMKEGTKTIYSFQNRLIGRVLNQDISFSNSSSREFSQTTSQVFLRRNQEITLELANALSKLTKKALVRSPLTCETRKLVCQLCYGWSLATSRLVSIGEAVGVIAGQSIGEPGTQLTMRTFHTGGVFSAGITEQMKAPFSGTVEYEAPISGTTVRTPHGNLAFLTKTHGILFLKKMQRTEFLNQKFENKKVKKTTSENIQTYKLPPFTVLFARHGEFIEKETLFAQISALPIGQKQTQTIEQTIYSSFEGEVFYNNIDLLEDIDEKYGERISKSEDWARVWVLSAKIYKNPLQSSFFPFLGDLVSTNTVLNQIQWFQNFSKTAVFDFRNLETFSCNRTQYSKNFNDFLNLKLKTHSKNLSFLPFSFKKKKIQNSQSFFSTDKKKLSFPKNSRKSVLVFSNYKIKKQLLRKLDPALFWEPPFDRFVKPKNFFFQMPSLTQTKNASKNTREDSTTFFSYPYTLNTRFRFAKFLLQNRLFLPNLRPGFLNTWFKTKSFALKNSKKRVQNSRFTLKSQTDLTTLNNDFKIKLKFQNKKILNANAGHPALLTNFVPFFLNLSPLKKYLKRKKFYPTLESKPSRPFLNSLLLKKHETSNPFFSFTNPKMDFNVKDSSELKGRFRLQNKFGNKSKIRNNTWKNESFSIKTSLLFSPIQKITYSKFGYVSSLNFRKKDSDRFFSFLPLENRFHETAPGNPAFKTMQQKFNSIFSEPIKKAKNQGRFGQKKSGNTFGLNNVEDWNSPEKHVFHWFPKSFEFPINGLVFLENPDVSQKFFQDRYFETKQKPTKLFKEKTQSALSLLNLAHSYEIKSLNFQNKVFEKKQTIQKTRTFQNNCICSTFPKNDSKPSKTPIVKSKLEKKKANKKFFKTAFYPFVFENKFNTKKTAIQKRFSKNWTDFKELEFKPTKEFKSKLLQQKEKSNFKLKKNKCILFNTSHKKSVAFSEVFSLPQENYRFTGYLSNQISKMGTNFSFTVLKNPSFDFLNFKKFEACFTNLRGFKKPFSFQEEGLMTIHQIKSNPAYRVKMISKNNSCSFHFNQSPDFQTHFSQDQNLEEIKTLEKSRFLRQNFLNYIQTQKTRKKGRFRRMSTFEVFQKPPFFFNIPISSSVPSQILTFLPFVNVEKPVLQHSKNDRSFCSNSRAQFSFYNFKVHFKTGWFYITKKPVFLLKEKTNIIEPGKKLVDDIYFNQHKVLLEKRILSFDSKKTSLCVQNFTDFDFKNFTQSKTIQNRKTRYFKTNPCFRASRNFRDNRQSQKKAFVFFRPFNHKFLPNAQKMKQKFYKTFEQKKSLNDRRSFSFYKAYFETDLNLQVKSAKNLSSFAPPDFHLKAFDLKNFQSQPFKNSLTFQMSTKKEKISQKFSKKPIQKPKNFSRFLKFFRQTEIPKKRSFSNFEEFQKLALQLFKTSKQPSVSKFSHPFYSVNRLNFGQFQISLESTEFFTFDTSFSNIELNLSRQNILSQKKDFSLNFELKKYYFNLLASRKEKQKEQIEKSNLYLETSFRKFENKWIFFMESVDLNLDSNWLKSIPIFDYSLKYKYGFCVNQRLFASAFYKQQFKEILKFDFYNSNQFLKETLNTDRFLKSATGYGNFSDSFFVNPISKNQFRLKESTRRFQKIFSFTNFYSPFEGEILKDYTAKFALKNSQKSFNLYFDQSFEIERKTHKLLLTKADLFSLRFEDLGTFDFKEKRDFANKKNQQAFGLNSVNFEKNKFSFFQVETTRQKLAFMTTVYRVFQERENLFIKNLQKDRYELENFTTLYQNKIYKLRHLNFGLVKPFQKLRLGAFLNMGDALYSNRTALRSGQIVHLNAKKITLRKAEIFSISPKAILHTYNGHYITKNAPVMTLPFETLKTGDIVQGIPKVEQYLEARTTIRGRLFLNSLPFLLYAIYQRYLTRLNMEKAVRQSFLKIQQILVDGVQRVYRSQGVSIADKHLEIIVRQMTSKVKITYGGQTGFFSGEFVDLEFIERVNSFLKVKVCYEPVVLGITRASLEVDSFLSAASFQQTTKVLTRASLENKKDFLKGLKENLLVGNLLPAGTGAMTPLSTKFEFSKKHS
jgi:hypothetical protein